MIKLPHMRVANIFVGTIAIVWFALFLLGRGLIRGVYGQGPGIAPNAGQIDYYIIFPMIAVALSLITGWAGNLFRKPLLIVIPSLLIGFAILPFLFGYAGGM